MNPFGGHLKAPPAYAGLRSNARGVAYFTATVGPSPMRMVGVSRPPSPHSGDRDVAQGLCLSWKTPMPSNPSSASGRVVPYGHGCRTGDRRPAPKPRPSPPKRLTPFQSRRTQNVMSPPFLASREPGGKPGRRPEIIQFLDRSAE